MAINESSFDCENKVFDDGTLEAAGLAIDPAGFTKVADFVIIEVCVPDGIIDVPVIGVLVRAVLPPIGLPTEALVYDGLLIAFVVDLERISVVEMGAVTSPIDVSDNPRVVIPICLH
jgi:hypothetical protein